MLGFGSISQSPLSSLQGQAAIGYLAATESPDAATGAVLSIAHGNLSSTESGLDTFAATVRLICHGALSAAEIADTFAGVVITQGSVTHGILNAVDAPDSFAGSAHIIVLASGAILEISKDGFYGTGQFAPGSIKDGKGALVVVRVTSPNQTAKGAKELVVAGKARNMTASAQNNITTM